MKLLVTGAAGMLGRDVMQAAGNAGHRSIEFVILALVALPLLLPAGARALDVPDDYQFDAPIEGLTRPSAIAFDSESGDVFVAERIGRVKVFHGIDDPQPDLVVDIRENVHAFIDRGMMGMALDPEYPAEPYLYVSYTRDAPLGEGPPPVHEENPDGSDTCVRISTGELDEEGDCIASARVSRFELPETFGAEVLGADDEQPLVTGWCQQFHSHSMDDLEFDSEGALLVSAGEAANFAALDYGQFGNRCGDPEFEGGSLRSQDLRGRWNDPVGYDGTIIRIDPATGAPWPTNTRAESESDAARIVAYGLRNPFRMAIRPGTNELFTTDVGSSYFDEINRIPDLLERPKGWPLNFGWPCYEGFGVHPGWHALSFGLPLPICVELYENPPVNLASPFFAYPRAGELFGTDECDPSAGAALAGLTFYELPESPPPGALTELDGSLLLADAARGCVWEMDSDSAGRPDPDDVRNLITRDEDHGSFTPVNFATGPGGELFIPDFWGNRIGRLRYFEDNQPPEARVSADPAPYGLMDGGEFKVTLDGRDSSDAEDAEEELEYAWDLDGDGTFEKAEAEPTEEVKYTKAENVVAQLRVTDTEGATDVARITLYPGNLPPSNPMITLPAADHKWNVGEEIELEAPQPSDPANDDDDGEDPRLDWEVTLEHCPDRCHSHPQAHVTGTSGSFTTPDHEYPSHVRIVLTATDSRGLSATPAVREIFPNTVDVTLRSDPPGVPLTIASTTGPAPFAERLLSGGDATVSAPETATIGGRRYDFAAWSDGGARNHLVSQTADATLVARYVPVPLPGVAQTGLGFPPRAGVATRTRLRFVTRPGGLPLRVGRRWRRSRFGLWLERGRAIRLAAPRRLVRRGRLFTFKRWKSSRRRVRRIGAGRSRTYVAVFRSRPVVRDGKRQALSWRRRAK